MDRLSENTLHRIEQNDDALSELRIGGSLSKGEFHSSNSDDFSRLGAAIGNNTHLTELIVDLHRNSLAVEDRGFYDGLKRNSSIVDLILLGDNSNNNNTIIGGVLHEVLKVYQENSTLLTQISIRICNLVNGGEGAVAATLRRCIYLKCIELINCGITDEQLLPIVEGIRGHRFLEKLDLYGNSIGAAGYQALATLLEDPNCHICTLDLRRNRVDMNGAIAIVNSLSNNNRLRNLDLGQNPVDSPDSPSLQPSLQDAFDRLLCNTSNINDTYDSNHTLESTGLRHSTDRLEYLLDLNKDTNKSRVVIKKILKYHPNIDMEPLFDWDADEDEQNLKALPHVVGWFDRAKEAVADDDENYNVEEKKLTAIMQFAKAMPLLFVPASHIKKNEHKKRKRDDNM